jgi:hypothetical protein
MFYFIVDLVIWCKNFFTPIKGAICVHVFMYMTFSVLIVLGTNLEAHNNYQVFASYSLLLVVGTQFNVNGVLDFFVFEEFIPMSCPPNFILFVWDFKVHKKNQWMFCVFLKLNSWSLSMSFFIYVNVFMCMTLLMSIMLGIDLVMHCKFYNA